MIDIDAAIGQTSPDTTDQVADIGQDPPDTLAPAHDLGHTALSGPGKPAETPPVSLTRRHLGEESVRHAWLSSMASGRGTALPAA